MGSELACGGRSLTIGELLEAHPWPTEYAGARRLEWLWQIDVPLAPAELWPLVSDVSRLNRALGNPEMDFEERSGERWGRARYNGVRHVWREVPWDWVANRWFSFVRIYTKGAMRAFYSVLHLEPAGTSTTRVHQYFGAVPRWAIFVPPLKLSFAQIGRRLRKTLPALAAEHRDRLPPVYVPPPAALTPVGAQRLAAIERDLRGRELDATAIDRLVAYVRDGDELDLHRIQVRERARAWGLDEDALLRVFLHATRAGLLDMAWDVVCPHCRGVRASQDRLAEVPRSGACEVCDVTFGTEAALEITFRVHASLRPIAERLYCSAEPATKPHIQVQRAVPPGADAAVDVDLQPGRYRLRKRGRNTVAGWLEVGAAASEPGPALAWRASAPLGERPAEPHAALTLVNDLPTSQTFIIEAARPIDLALRPGRLFSHPEFRDLFAEEFLGTDVRIEVGQQTILFTDLVGSTAMYATRGDAAAFAAVKRHFTDIFAIIAAHGGALVKTIGDAVMAAFHDPAAAVRAAGAIQHAFTTPDGLRVRISLNTDKCIAVRLATNIDYFGHAVNLAAKLQSVAASGQVALSAQTFATPSVQAYLAEHASTLQRVEVPIKGLAAAVIAHVWTVHTR
ncbi:MAG TPA: DUF5939 domain-containing protein [Kofleriaceae bacterium]|nr:DUF5939 domain-containing protein [Kofleriaceae bacterium]